MCRRRGTDSVCCSKVWDTHTGELLFDLKHDHIVRAIAYPFSNSGMLATGGMEKKLRIFDLIEAREEAPTRSPTTNGNAADGDSQPVAAVEIPTSRAFEIGAGSHTDSIKFIIWATDPTVLVTAAGNTLRWFNLPSRNCVREQPLESEIKSCELVSLAISHSSEADIGSGLPVMAVAAGKTVSFWGGLGLEHELKRISLSHGVASVALDVKQRKFVVGEEPGTWARVYRYDDGSEIGLFSLDLISDVS